MFYARELPMKTLMIATAGLLLLGALPAQQRDGSAAFEALLRRHDADFDGRISRAEYPRSAAAFRRLDRDQDGYLSAADFGMAQKEAPAFSGAAADPSDAMSPAQVAFFENEIRPLLVVSCYGCHSSQAQKLRGEFRLDSRAALLTGGPSGPALVPGNPDDSLLMHAVRYADEDLQMPPKQPLAPEQVALLEQWIRDGAPWPKSAATGTPEVEVVSASQDYDFAKAREHWAFRPVEKSAPPTTKRADWAKGEIDSFLLAAMEGRGVQPVADADRRTWLRRVTLDLTGLPPTPQELAAFEADASVTASENSTVRLLKRSLPVTPRILGLVTSGVKVSTASVLFKVAPGMETTAWYLAPLSVLARGPTETVRPVRPGTFTPLRCHCTTTGPWLAVSWTEKVARSF